MTKPFQTYDGGKNGEGTFQTIINFIPPHIIKVIGFAGNCGIAANIKPAELNVLIDLDISVAEAWEKMNLGANWKVRCLDTVPKLFNLDVFLKQFVINPPVNKTFVYLDPPYLMDTRKQKGKLYKHELSTTHEHEHLLSGVLTAASMGFKIMISHYPNALYDKWLKGWHTHDFLSTIRGGQALERIYYNYDLSDGKLHDYSFIGEDFRQREALVRVKKNFIEKFNRLPVPLKNAILQELAQGNNDL